MLSAIRKSISMVTMPHRCPAFICSSSLAAGLALVALSPGCNSAARYDVVAPASARGEVAQNAGPILSRDNIDYEVFQAQEKVIVRFVNRTGQPMRLTEQSVILDTAGRSYAVEPQEVPQDQAGRIVLPPATAVDTARPAPIATEVHVGGVDEGGLIGTRRDVESNRAGGGPRGATAAPEPGFRWPVNGQARLRLAYRVGEATEDLMHDWTIRRSR